MMSLQAKQPPERMSDTYQEIAQFFVVVGIVLISFTAGFWSALAIVVSNHL